jgi:hypothetical protein
MLRTSVVALTGAAKRGGLRQQLVVGRHHRVRAHPVPARAFAYRRQARARRHQALADVLGEAARQLLGERGVGMA